MQYSSISGILPVTRIGQDPTATFHSLIEYIINSEERNDLIAGLICTSNSHKVIILTSNVKLHMPLIQARLARTLTHTAATIHGFPSDAIDNIVHTPTTESKLDVNLHAAVNASDNQILMMMTYLTFHKLYHHYCDALLAVHNYAKAAHPEDSPEPMPKIPPILRQIFDHLGTIILATPHKDIDTVIECAQFGADVERKAIYLKEAGTTTMLAGAAANNGGVATGPRARTPPAPSGNHHVPIGRRATNAVDSKGRGAGDGHGKASTGVNSTTAPRPHSPPPPQNGRTDGKVPATSSGHRLNVNQQVAVQEVLLATSLDSNEGEKKHSARKESPENPSSEGSKVTANQNGSVDVVDVKDHLNTSTSTTSVTSSSNSYSNSSGHHGFHGRHKQKCKVCDIADNHDMLSNWSKWHVEKSERILCYGREKYNKDEHYEHSKNI